MRRPGLPSSGGEGLWRRMLWHAAPMAAVLALGTLGFMYSDGWDAERALYFTIITVSTVGYGDYELSDAGRRVAALVILLGIGTMTYCIGQLFQTVVQRHLDWERAMHKQAERMRDHFVIVGFGRLGRCVCESLHAEQIPFVVIDKEHENVEEAVRRGYVAVGADATEDDVLRKCGVDRARGVLCLTPSDTVNIVTTLTARGMSPDLPIISRAESDDAIRKMRQAGATRVVSPVHRGAVAVAQSIIRPHVVDLVDEGVDVEHAVEFCRVSVREGSPLASRTLGETGLERSDGFVVAAIESHSGEVKLCPGPDVRLDPGDVLVFAGHPGAVIEACSEAA